MMFHIPSSLLRGVCALTPSSHKIFHRIGRISPMSITTARWVTSSETKDAVVLNTADAIERWREHPKVNPRLEFPTIVVPVDSLTSLIPKLQPFLAKNSEIAKHVHPRIKMVKDHSDTHKLLLITNEEDKDGNGDIIDRLTESLQIDPDIVKKGPILGMDVSFSQLSYQYILSQLLTPIGVPIPTSYEQIGHIAHFNFKPVHKPYGRIIAEVLTETNPTIKTVVAKVGEVHGDYRTYDFDVLAGPEMLETTVVEHGVRIRLHIGECYWCSRLGGERQLLIQDILNPPAVPSSSGLAKRGGECSDKNEGDRDLVVADVFSGVGAVCLLLAKQAPELGKNVTVLANDWNPRAIEYFGQSIQLNSGLDADRFHLSNIDAYDFIMDLGTGGIGGGKGKKGGKKNKGRTIPDHVLMNFPLHGPTYLGALRWWHWKNVQQFHTLYNTYPRFHVYTFAKDKSTPEDGRDNESEQEIALDVVAEELLPRMNSPKDYKDGDSINKRTDDSNDKFHRRREIDEAFGTQFSTRFVRDVAPGKVVVCVSFFLTPKLIRYMQGDYR